MKALGLAAALALTVSAMALKAEQRSTDSRTKIADLSRDWIETGWRHRAEGERFDFRDRLEHYYDWNANDVILHDNADPQRRVAQSASDYARVWDELIPNLKALDNSLIEEPSILMAGDIAVATLRFESRFEDKDGSVQTVPTLATLVWRKTEAGWRIIREHGSALAPEKAS